MAGFFFTGDEASTPEAIDRKRQLINALAKDNLSSAPVGHWTQALARVLGAGADRYETANLNKTEKVETEKNKAAFNDYYASILGGASPPALNAGAALPASQPAPATPAVQGGSSAGGEPSPSLVRSESGGNWQAQNDAMGAGGQRGHFGRLQFGQARIQDAINAGVLPAGTTPQAFMASPQLQQAAERWHFGDIDKAISSGPAAAAIGRAISGVPVTQEGLRAVAHLGGTGGMNKFVQSNGAYNPADANGTTLLSYLAQHGRGGGGAPQGAAPAPAAPQAGMGGGQNPQTAQLLAALSSPWASRNPMLAQMAAATLTKQFSRDPIDDQIRRIDLAQKQRDLTESKPFTIKVDGEDVSVIRDAQNNIRRVQLAGDPAGGQPRTYQMPDGRVVQLPADPTARKKMLEEFGSTGAKAIEGAPGAITTAQQSLSVVEKLIGSEDGKIKPHPGLPNVFGLYGKIPTRPGSDTADAESFIAQIKDRSFLEGIAAMKGSGAISEAEGTKAAGAVARLNTNQSPKAFEESLKELRGILRTAMQRNQTISNNGRSPSVTPPSQSPASGEKWNDIAPGIRIREL